MSAKNNIAKIRISRGLAQRDLARAAGIPRGVLSMMESGKYYTGLPELEGLAAVLESTPAELYPAEILRAVYGIGAERRTSRPIQATVNLRVPRALAERLDAFCLREGIASRDEACRYLLRRGLDEYEGRLNQNDA